MATHQLDEASRQLTLRTMPLHREEVPMLGRIELIHDALGENRSLEFVDVMRIDNRNLLENEAYAWSWAAAKLLDAHPRYQNRFRALKKHVLRPDFNELVRRDFETDWADLNIEWRAFVAALDHGHDFERMAIEFRRGTPLANQMQQTVTIRADRGWQSSGVWLDAGRSYHVAANGRFVISKENVGGTWHAWPSEPGGVTIAYHAGRPLGQLLGAIDNRGAGGGGPDATFANPLAIGLSTTITPAASGTLYLRVNDSSGRLGDNDGTLTVVIDAK
jgi:hypothetical protein